MTELTEDESSERRRIVTERIAELHHPFQPLEDAIAEIDWTRLPNVDTGLMDIDGEMLRFSDHYWGQ